MEEVSAGLQEMRDRLTRLEMGVTSGASLQELRDRLAELENGLAPETAPQVSIDHDGLYIQKDNNLKMLIEWKTMLEDGLGKLGISFGDTLRHRDRNVLVRAISYDPLEGILWTTSLDHKDRIARWNTWDVFEKYSA